MPKEIKHICCIGAGYVGGPTMAVIADKCPNIIITIVDLDRSKIDNWNSNDLSKLPVYEPGLKEIIEKRRGKNLFFSTEIKNSIANSDMVFLSVNTPTKQRGIGAGEASDLRYIESSARQVAEFAKGETIVVEKSTIPVKTAETIKNILFSSKDDFEDGDTQKVFHVLSNPEFLAEGTAISDLENPSRVLIGGENQEAINSLSAIYLNWVDEEKIIKTNLWSSELSKLSANAFLAQRVSSINSLSALCEVTGANISEVSKAIGMDYRIGEHFLETGPGFGGSCFKKDILNLIYICKFYGLYDVASYWSKVIEINLWQQERISKIIINKLFGNLSNKKIGILGFSFKANTNDTRESPAIKICKDLLEEGAKLAIYDPKVDEDKIKNNLKEVIIKNDISNMNIEVTESIEDVGLGSDAIVILTEWEEFKLINWNNFCQSMRKPTWIFDCRNIIDKNLINNKINLWSLGNNS